MKAAVVANGDTSEFVGRRRRHERDVIVTAQTLHTNTLLFSSVLSWRRLSAKLAAASRRPFPVLVWAGTFL